MSANPVMPAGLPATIHKSRRYRPCSVLCLLVAAALPIRATADASEPDTTELDAVVVSGEWLGEASLEAEKTYAGSRTVTGSKELHERGALNLEDAMRATPGVQILDETGTGILPNIGIRGLNPLRSERVQMLVDGYPIAIGPYSNVGVSLFPVTLASLEAIDVVRGGAAVHFGPNNVGGVLNFTTRPIPFKTEQSLHEQLTVAGETGHVFADSYYRIGGQVSDKLGLQLQANLQRGDGFRQHSETEVDNFIVDSRYFVNYQNTLTGRLQYYKVRAELPGALSPQAYEEDRTQSQRPHDAYDADMLRGTLTWTYTPTADVEFQWRNFAHDADRTFFFGQNLSGSGNVFDPAIPATHVADSPRLFKVGGTEPRLTLRADHHTVIVGARYLTEDVDFDVNREALATGARSSVRDWSLKTKAVAVYVSDTLRFAGDRLSITPGLRYEDVRMDFTDIKNAGSESNHAKEWLPGLTLGYQTTEQLFLFANSQRSLVPVQIAQATRQGDVANETAWNYEAGGRIQALPGLLNSLTFFRNDYEDQIQFNQTADRFENLGKTRHQGIELDNRLQLNPHMEFGLSYTYLDTEQLNGANAGKQLPNAPRHHLSTEASYQLQRWNASLAGHYVGESFSDAINTQVETANGGAGKLPDYVLLTARVGCDIIFGNERGMNLGVSVNNLLDEDYYFRGADVSPVGRVPSPGRSYLLTAKVGF